MTTITATPIPSVQPLVMDRWCMTALMRCAVEPLVAGRPKRSGNWWTTMITATPARNPVMMGADRSSAIHPRRRMPTRATRTPTITASNPTRAM